MIRLFSVVLILFGLFFNSHCLRWTKSGFHTTPDTVYSLFTAQASPEIDVGFGKQITINKNVKGFDRGFSMYCFVSGFSTNSPTTFEFCKDKDCLEVADGAIVPARDLYGLNINITSAFPGMKGMKIFIKILMSTVIDVSGNFYCKAKNGVFTIRSNNVEIRDTYYWDFNSFSEVISNQRTEIKKITPDNLPVVLNCSSGPSKLSPGVPKWFKAEFVSPTTWGVCPVLKSDMANSVKNTMNEDICLKYAKDRCETNSISPDICPRTLNKMPDWSTYVNQGGDLIFTGLRPQSSSNIGSYSLICMAKTPTGDFKTIYYFYDVSLSTSITGIVIDGTVPATPKTLTMISPKVQQFVIYARRVSQNMDSDSFKPVALYALYTSSPDVPYVWKKDGVQLNSNNIMTLDRYTVTFPGEISSDQAGKYTLEVIDKTEKIIMEINVLVLGPPILIMEACMIPLMYVWAGGNVLVSCDYKQNPTSIVLQINSQDINLAGNLDDTRANLKISHPYLELLNFTATSTVTDQITTLTYKAYNLTKTLGQTQYQDQTIAFVAANDFGMSVKTTSIYVVPDLRSAMVRYPEKDNCTSPCSSSSTHKFQCVLTASLYDNKELTVEVFWTINSNRLDDSNNDKNIFARYFSINPITKELTMNPIKSNSSENDKLVKAALKDNYIECNVNINSNSKESNFFYFSTNDKNLGSSMKAKITLDYVPISTAYVYWIIAVILGVIVLIILIVLLTRYCMKNKGDTYPLDKLEREHGYDPEKEVQEEIFKPYERQDNQMAPMPGSDEERRLSIGGHSIGSNNDGEMDNYDLDPSNFNEDSSIVGKYGANPRSRAEMA